MTKEQLNYMCNTYGDPTLSNDEKWKSIAYYTTTTGVPTYSFQDFLKKNAVTYLETIAEPGFHIFEYEFAHSGPTINRDNLLVTYVPLEGILSVSVTPYATFNKGYNPSEPILPVNPDIIINNMYGAADISDDETTYIITFPENSADPSIEYDLIYDGVSANAANDE